MVTTDFLEKYAQIDQLMMELWGTTLQGFSDSTYARAYQNGSSLGYRRGKTDGARRAKGLDGPARPRGRPKLLDDGTLAWMDAEVTKLQAGGLCFNEAVREFIEPLEKGAKKLGHHVIPISTAKRRLHERRRKKTV